ncbi:MAG: hypothetical protein JSR48_02400 [Verrucomicrobia bacterium]|nr:hypothetical protein [Verrucomicrobiota bacterium]
MTPAAPAPVPTVDAQHPWLGLVSFTEETRAFFHGREEEAAELSRRVQRKLLTVLFGQSGLGKTSILQAGLVPRLRPEGFCPVYVRLDYDPHSPSPADQIKRAVFRATEAAGTWTKTGSAVAGETLWEFLHHRDDVLKDATGRTLVPILIFDQFEEIFTLAQSDDAGRRRAQEFLADLADLVENRPPRALEARIDRDEADAAKFDFARADYRILISLREDYLAHLEGLKAQMPSVTQNRMRLARMTGAQAVAAVRSPAPHLVSEAVAESIVRFVAGGTELERAEVEPSLLSLICRELNNTRLARGHAEISADLLAGSRDTILTEFYERALADQPAGVRVFIEDEMLTESGYRESVAEERVRKAFVAAGAPAEALAKLVDRRLLRVEDRLDLRRVEITHDVLCSVVSASRTVRHEREALEESKRELAAQQERERATRRALVRARLVAAVASVLMLLALASAVFGWVSLRRARAAEAQTQAARRLAEQARGESEKLIGFLLEDFYQELMPTGRVEVVGKLAEKAVAYYDNLPPELQTPQTKFYRGMALVRKASALTDSGRSAEAEATRDAAVAIFTELRAADPGNDDLATGLALAEFATISTGGFGDTRARLERAIGLLRPIEAAGRASRSAKLGLSDMLQYLAHTEVKPENGITDCEESRQILARMGALDLSDLTASSIYGDVTDTESRVYQRMGRSDDAERLSRIVGDLAEKVLAQRPGDLRAMRDRYFSTDMQGQVARDRHDLARAEACYLRSEDAARYYARFNPADSAAWMQLGQARLNLADVRRDQGRVTDAMQVLQQATAIEQESSNRTGMAAAVFWGWMDLYNLHAQRGEIPAARAAFAEVRRTRQQLLKDRNLDHEMDAVSSLALDLAALAIPAAEGNYREVHDQAVAIRAKLEAFKVTLEGNRDFRTSGLRAARRLQVDAALKLGNYEEAASAAQQLVERSEFGRNQGELDRQRLRAEGQARLALALIRLGRVAEARPVLAEMERYYRQKASEGATEVYFIVGQARLLYLQALAEPADAAGSARRRADLDDALGGLRRLSFEAQQLQEARDLISDINAAREASPS